MLARGTREVEPEPVSRLGQQQMLLLLLLLNELLWQSATQFVCLSVCPLRSTISATGHGKLTQSQKPDSVSIGAGTWRAQLFARMDCGGCQMGEQGAGPCWGRTGCRCCWVAPCCCCYCCCCGCASSGSKRLLPRCVLAWLRSACSEKGGKWAHSSWNCRNCVSTTILTSGSYSRSSSSKSSDWLLATASWGVTSSLPANLFLLSFPPCLFPFVLMNKSEHLLVEVFHVCLGVCLSPGHVAQVWRLVCVLSRLPCPFPMCSEFCAGQVQDKAKTLSFLLRSSSVTVIVELAKQRKTWHEYEFWNIDSLMFALAPSSVAQAKLLFFIRRLLKYSQRL